MAESGFATLTVVRDSDKDIKIRGLEVLIDGKFIVDLAYGKQHTLELEPGPHTVTATNRLYTRKLEIELSPRSTRTLRVGNVVTGLGGVMMVTLGIGPYRVFIEEA